LSEGVLLTGQIRNTDLLSKNQEKKTMKKLLSIAFVLVSIMFVASSADAQNRNNQRNPRVDQPTNQTYNQNNRQVVRTYTETKTVYVRGKQYLETYQVQVFRNGRTTSKLISRVEVKNRRGNNKYDNGKVSYKTATIWENGRKYKVKYKITKYRNGRTTSQVVSKIPVR
jgi:hypothetical protein